ncbi:PleD family two-component system response regulator [Aestuariivirga litoralis]|uniref:diguanylate cyclase n=1 Tax=Aestuariivirga litoralis TaxID=2650924 RepID=A0A2W2AJ06_9HYPH|nr:PleD family two-component system response regulator [Aestuariivirga litoralis]PZF75425.1 PleD family two-component system response regulator [Aestuariivirga litoralis]
MTARVLVVDDILANVRLLEAKLAAEYFEVVTAMNGADALEAVNRTRPDIVLLDVMMPGIDGIEVCRRIKQNPATQHIPVVMVTALDQPEDRVRGLEAGADDFLTKPVNDVALFCRVKGLVRLKMLTDELRARTGADPLGLAASEPPAEAVSGRILVLDNRVAPAERIRNLLSPRHEVTVVSEPQQAFEAFGAAQGGFDLIIVNLDLEGMDGLRICSQLKSVETTRQTPILILVDPEDHQRLLRALDMGVNDYLIRPIDRQELLARVATQVRRHRYTEQLRLTVRASMEMAVTDALTGLYNRRYLETQLTQLIEQSADRGKGLSMLSLDIDFFKSVNDTYGHDAGDRVLQEVAGRIRGSVRGGDLACRTGGEEFVVVLPGADLAVAEKVGERIRKAIAAKPFMLGPGSHLTVTASLGVSSLLTTEDTLEGLLKRADRALYRAKREGRNRVVPVAA